MEVDGQKEIVAAVVDRWDFCAKLLAGLSEWWVIDSGGMPVKTESDVYSRE